MSATEILEELSNLPLADLERVYRRAIELHQGRTLQASPELLAAIDQADQSLTEEGGVTIEEAIQIAQSWNIK